MKERNPMDREDLNIKANDKVLEVGGGHNPTFRANVIVEKFVDSNYHRSDEVKIFPHQEFFNADGSNMPFVDNEFDYVICNQVLEHVEDPIVFINELQRVAKRGYIELPSLIGESLFPKESHKWVCLEINNQLVLFEKSKLPSIYPNLGRAFLNFLPHQSIALRIFYSSYHQAHTVRYEWNNEINILVNPTDEYYSSFFLLPWTDKMCKTIFPYFSKKHDLLISFKALLHLAKVFILNHYHSRTPITLRDYKKLIKQ